MIYSCMLSNPVHVDLFHKCWALFLHLQLYFSCFSCPKTRGKVMMITLTKVKSYNRYIIQSTWNSMMSYDYFPKVLEGNKDRNSNVKHVLYGVLTRYLRFLPQTHQGEVCMRTEVFGVQQKPSKSKNHYVMWSLHLLIYEQRFQT